MYVKSFPLIIILLLFISSFSMPLIRKKSIVKGISFATNFLSVILAILTYFYVNNNGTFKYKMGHFEAPWGIEFNIGIIECVIAILFTVVSFLITWYSMYRIEKNISDKKIPLYYLLFNILLASLLGMVFTNDIFNAFVFIEVSTLASCGIIVVKDNKETVNATIKYLVLSSLGSGLILMGIAFLYSITGNLNMNFIHSELVKVWMNYRKVVLISVGLFTVGLGIKGAMFPLHIWMPDAYTSPIDSSTALLSSIGAKAIIFLLIKVLYRMFGTEIIYNIRVLDVILVLGSMGMIVGSLLAMFQKDGKRVVAYSSVAQMGYIFLGIGLGNPLGLAAAIFHIISHAFTKPALFLCIDSMRDNAGKRIENLRGIGKEMPITLGLFTLGALSMVGIPIFPGFFSKWNLSLASVNAGQLYLLAFILLSSLLNAVYYFPIVINGYFGEENTKGKIYMDKEQPIVQIIPIGLLILGMVCSGVMFNQIMKTLLIASKNMM